MGRGDGDTQENTYGFFILLWSMDQNSMALVSNGLATGKCDADEDAEEKTSIL